MPGTGRAQPHSGKNSSLMPDALCAFSHAPSRGPVRSSGCDPSYRCRSGANILSGHTARSRIWTQVWLPPKRLHLISFFYHFPQITSNTDSPGPLITCPTGHGQTLHCYSRVFSSPLDYKLSEVRVLSEVPLDIAQRRCSKIHICTFKLNGEV